MIDTRAFFREGRTALVIIDLQRGIAGRQTAPYAGAEVVTRAASLVQAFEALEPAHRLCARSFNPGGADALRPLLDAPVKCRRRLRILRNFCPNLARSRARSW